MSVNAQVRIAVATAFLLAAHAARAGGLYVPLIGTPSAGTSSAGANAVAEDASTAIQNPAGMTRLDGHQLVTSLAPGYSNIRFDADENPVGGGDGGQQGGFVPISSNQYVHKLSERWRLGLSLVSISGAGLDPKDSWAGRNELTKESLFTLTVAPTAAVRLCDWLSVGGGIGITYGRLDLKLRLPLPLLGEPRLELKNMDDVAVAPIASILLEPLDNLRIGVLYQGETDFHLDGRVKLLGEKSDLKLELPLAQAVRASILFAPTERITLLGSAGWEDWSVAKDLPISAPGGSATVPLGFHDTWFVAGGVEVRLNDAWSLQTGLRHDSSALSDGDRTTAFPINRSYTTSAGVIYDWSDSLRLAAAFTWVNYGKARVSNPVVSGDYRDNDLFALNLSLVWKKLPWSGWASF